MLLVIRESFSYPLIIFFLRELLSASCLSDECRQTFKPQTDVQRTPGDNGFRLRISRTTNTYIPGAEYTVTLHGWRTSYSVQKLIGFWIRAVPRDGRIRASSAGKFEHFNEDMVTYADHCTNVITNRTMSPREDVQAVWRAPRIGSGCIQIRATVIEYKNIWYEEEGGLVKELCEEDQQDQQHIQHEQNLDYCCVCDDAKYEILFTGLWSPQMHPKDFPTTLWFTHFSDLIGATHSPQFKIYEVGGYASEGLQQLAEWGKTQELEKELKTKYPNVNGQTHAVFRTDRKHHLLSFATMFGPSPDWLVGVDSLNLCLKNCSWVDYKELELYPFDAGTDSGITYMSENSPTHPREQIKNITSSYPKNAAAPFFDPSGKPMLPLAKITVTKQKIYEKACDDPNPATTSEEVFTVATDSNANRMECAVSEFGLWSDCLGSCNQGSRMRSRQYLNQAKATMNGCTQQLIEKEMCDPCGTDSGVQKIDATTVADTSAVCMTSPWSEWSECSVTCGTGMRTRSRMFKNPMGEKFCSDALMEKEECSSIDCQVATPECKLTPWSSWSPCSVTCGKGTQARRRQYLYPRKANGCRFVLNEKRGCIANRTTCDFDPMEQKVICMQPKVVGSCYGFMPRWYFDADRGLCQPFVYTGCRGNLNNFENYEDCNRVCERIFDVPVTLNLLTDSSAIEHLQGLLTNSVEPSSYFTQLSAQLPSVMIKNGMICAPLPTAPSSITPSTTSLKQFSGTPVDCQVSSWGHWSACSISCGKGSQSRFRHILIHPQNGGIQCPPRMEQRRKCHGPPCPSSACIFGDWSDWMPKCSCEIKFQQRTRMIHQYPSDSTACHYVPAETRPCIRSTQCGHGV